MCAEMGRGRVALKRDMDHGTRVEFRNTSLPIESVMFFPSSERPGYWKLKIALRNPDRDTGEMESFGTEWFIKKYGKSQPMTRKYVAQKVREIALDMLTHELDEALHVDGVRVFDPHPKKKRKKV